jgi:hypothetical protein
VIYGKCHYLSKTRAHRAPSLEDQFSRVRRGMPSLFLIACGQLSKSPIDDFDFKGRGDF